VKTTSQLDPKRPNTWPDFLTVEQFATLIGKPRRTVQEWIMADKRSGKPVEDWRVRAFQPGGHSCMWEIPKAQAIRYLRERAVIMALEEH
jgi:hypothetical protein